MQNIAGNMLKREVGGETNIFNLLKFSLEVMKWNRMEFAGMLNGVMVWDIVSLDGNGCEELMKDGISLKMLK